MKICFLIADMSARGGTERVTSLIANGLSQRNYAVDIISCRNKAVSFFELNKDIKLYSLNAECIKNKIWRKFINLKKIWKLANERQYDVVVAVDVYLYLYLLPLQIMRKSKCIAWEHFNCYIASMKSSGLARAFAANLADQVVVLGKKDLSNYLHKYGEGHNIRYIYNPVTFEKTMNRNLNEHRIIAAGRLVNQKGFDLLIDAWNIIEKSDKSSDWILDIYGKGELEAQLLDQINNYGLKRVHLKGYSNNIDTEYLSASIFVLSSRFEGWGLVLIEAQACGLPCVSFDCPEGPGEIIDDGINGYLVENGNIEQLANKLMELMHNERLREKFSNNAHKDLQRFDLQEVLNKWEELLDKLSS